MTHTPASWNARAINDDLRFSHWVDSESGTPLADVRSYDNSEANARLISAAPELLEALEGAQKVIRKTMPSLSFDDSIFAGEWLDTINAAIAKAKGES